MRELTIFEKQALESVQEGADIFSRGVAVVLRGLESDGLVSICEAQGNYPGNARQPYFGVIITAKGKQALTKGRL